MMNEGLFAAWKKVSVDALGIQLVGLAIFGAVVAGSYRAWVRPHNASMAGNGLLLLIVLTMAGGLIGSTAWWFDTPSGFPWDLPPLASRLLAVAGWAFGAATFMALRRPIYERVRLVLLMLAVYLLPLALAIVAFHLDRFDPNAPITYAFFIIVAALVLPMTWYLYRQPLIIPATAAETALTHGIWRTWLLLVALITGVWGVALFLTDNGVSALIWVWTGDVLSSRLIAVMLLTLMVAALYSLRSVSAAQVTLVTLGVYGLGVALASLWNATAGKPIPPLYVGVFGLMGLISLGLMWQAGRQLEHQTA